MPDDERESTPASPAPGARPGLYHNRVSWSGLVLSALSLANIVFLILVERISKNPNPYVGIFTWVIIPAFFVLGGIIFVLGLAIEWFRRRRLGPEEEVYPVIDLSTPAAREKIVVVVLAGLFFIMLSAVGSYQAYEYSDSVTFCGETCHVPMHPEMTAYQASPHARVRCVDCHVGPGAGWYVRSKLSGAYQIYANAFNKFPRPIPTPVHNLRPAQETCEQCHWPERFIGAQLKVFTHYAYDEQNTPRQIRLLLKTGGGAPESGLSAGIHWHMNIAVRISYVATDPQRQKIPWIRVQDLQGHVTVYRLKDSNLTDGDIAKLPQHRMDCIDCHNRPSHIYVAPDRSIDQALFGGRIDPTLPGIKSVAVTALSKDYKTTDEALQTIARDIDDAYKSQHADIYHQRKAAIDQAISAAQLIFQTTIFPEMKTDWRTHPNNIGHFYNLGCFRCHDGQHVSADGKEIRKDCNICHSVLGQEEGSANLITLQGPDFKHPVDLGDMREVTCTDCHTGGPQ